MIRRVSSYVFIQLCLVNQGDMNLMTVQYSYINDGTMHSRLDCRFFVKTSPRIQAGYIWSNVLAR